MDTVDKVTSPLAQNVTCYTDCNQKVGWQGGEAFQTYFRQHANLPVPQIMALLEQPATGYLSDTEQEARKALHCLKTCRLSVTVRFLAQFLGSMEDESTVRAVGIVLGATSSHWTRQRDPQQVVRGESEDTKLFGVAFHKGFYRGARRVLRHEDTKRARFMKNMDILKQVFFEMYGPLKLAPQYARSHGIR
ncbi:MAG: hypothetical protein A2977_03585 [Alphaproteobacteria bacterium RIFCSPLOWO2_01_FULL_45_8]|nr:MAG: hypothetical protein A2065_01515 [Alphaproteobacteria bacterium GWB1_45_5]OFW76622.1 MAG: hypothetical protein A3K20_00365 [Alphaproteobacteria bacterium GWA1_45_9]OFW89706.1 MAG: hypothetical protein A2621_02255 [Alphaproteobacteria bacterium RIFCSPHIGHO2_01_FULL_41_14]OFW96112.1 MAG: hypothetical protein A2977_03585 [Alphaproteobacteria bacterium RIFCSPLOWO2_01_FULL_45_8]HCI49151.1 hypothetical protein [Holosporales bacterium]